METEVSKEGPCVMLAPVNQCHFFLTVPARLTLILSCGMDLENFPQRHPDLHDAAGEL